MKIVNQGLKKIEIPGFGSCLVREYSNLSQNQLMWTFTTDQTSQQDFYNSDNTYLLPKDYEALLKGVKTGVEPAEYINQNKIAIQNDKVPEVLRCQCGAPGEYWGMRLAYPLPICFSCIKVSLKNNELKISFFRRVLNKLLFWRK